MSTAPSPVLVNDFIVDDDAERHRQLIEVVRKYVPLKEFQEAEMDDAFDVSVLSGGITNQLYRVRIRNGHSVVVRVFGKETQRIISRESELFYQSLFLTTYCQGKNFLIYEFLAGYRDIDFLEMPTHRISIARQFAKFHHVATENSKRAGRFDNEVLSCVDTLRQWSNDAFAIEATSKLNDEQRGRLATAGLTRDCVQQHVQELLAQVDSIGSSLVVGVCHNDLLCANIMRREQNAQDADASNDNTLVFIDFEYGNRNYLLYDLANHFNEYVGLECNYDKLFPTDEVILEFVTEYRCAMRDLLTDSPSPVFGETTRQSFFSQNDDDEKAICLLWVKYVKLLTLASNAMWSCWSILQAAHSVIDFDFVDYGTQRWRRFLTTKAAFGAPV